MAALGLGLALAEAALPWFGRLVRRDLSLSLADPTMLTAVLVLAALTTLGAGLYPAVALSRLRPVEAVRHGAGIGGPTRLTRGLVLGQLALSVGLMTCTLVMREQMGLLLTRETGIDEEHVILVDTGALREMNPQHPLLIDEFRRDSRIAAVGSVRYDFMKLPTWGRHAAVREDGSEVDAMQYFVDDGFIEAMGLRLVAGRGFAQGDRLTSDEIDSWVAPAVVSQTLARRMGWADPIDQELRFDRSGSRQLRRFGGHARVIGVVQDFSFTSGHESPPPGVLILNKSLSRGLYEADLIAIRVQPGHGQAVLAAMRETWRRIVPESDFRFSYLAKDLEAYYREEFRWRGLVSWAAVGAVVIAALGAFAMTAQAAGRRTKEIGVRKVLGATTAGVTSMLTREFAVLALLACAVAWPLSYWTMRGWLQAFVYRVELNPTLFLSGGAVALSVVLVSAGIQALRAAVARPVDALRHE